MIDFFRCESIRKRKFMWILISIIIIILIAVTITIPLVTIRKKNINTNTSTAIDKEGIVLWKIIKLSNGKKYLYLFRLMTDLTRRAVHKFRSNGFYLLRRISLVLYAFGPYNN